MTGTASADACIMERTGQCATTMNLLKAGQVASKAGITVQALRHYERLRLLDSVTRTEGNHRLYSPEAVDRVRFIRDAQHVGLALSEVRLVLGTERAQAARCAVAAELLRNRLGALDALLHGLQLQRSSIAQALSNWEREEAGECHGHFCHVVESCGATARSAKAGRSPGTPAAMVSGRSDGKE